ncbi:MAG: hypothetical protein OXU64_09310 [Gemmatimonadota bacterium]|nr:hypothetical protein [Gemmatimonadota bacterium]
MDEVLGFSCRVARKQLERAGALLVSRLSELLAMEPCRVDEYLRVVPNTTGIYLISEKDTGCLYTGVSFGKQNRLRKRIGQHLPVPPNRPRENSGAILAERIAMEIVGLPSQTPRKRVYADEAFRNEFWRLRHRVRKMDIQYLAVADKREGKALETLAVLVLLPRYNW